MKLEKMIRKNTKDPKFLKMIEFISKNFYAPDLLNYIDVDIRVNASGVMSYVFRDVVDPSGLVDAIDDIYLGEALDLVKVLELPLEDIPLELARRDYLYPGVRFIYSTRLEIGI